jgi:hypothetical protein
LPAKRCRRSPAHFPFPSADFLFAVARLKPPRLPGDEAFGDTGPHGAVRGAGFVRNAAEYRLDHAFLEVFAGVSSHDCIAQVPRKLIEPGSERIETDSQVE